jgi:hypothetical protein
MNRTAIAPILLALAGCTDQARMYPMDNAALQAGTPRVEFVRQGLGHGPTSVTMPDGEILRGEYQITENAAVGVAIAGARTSTAIGYGSGRPFVSNATGDRGTLMNCEGSVDIGGHGSGVCETNKGGKYRVMF